MMATEATAAAAAAAAETTKERKPYFVINVQNYDNNGLSKQSNKSIIETNTSNKKKEEKQPPPTKSMPSTSSSTSPRTTTTTDNSSEACSTLLHVIVIAHPDDESLFFLPTIQALQQAGQTVWILCLTTGNYDGLGPRRRLELSKVCQLLQIPKLIQLDMESSMKDHPTQSWSLDAVAAELEKALSVALRSSSSSYQHAFQRIVLITFDLHGVSGHVNHRDTYLGVRNLVFQQQKQSLDNAANDSSNNNKGKNTKSNKQSKPKSNATLPPLEAWKLDTVHFLPVKYLPLVGWLLCLLTTCRLWNPTYTELPSQHPPQNSNSNTIVHTYRSVDPMLTWQAMATHQSQFVWYRRLFVVFSCYTFVNKLRPVQ